MSIFFDFDVGLTGRRFRRAVDGDKGDVKLFIDSSHTKLFGDVDIGALIELSTLSICMINAKKEVTGFMALCDHPNVPGVDPAHWEMWIRNFYQKFYLARNTLFIHFMCCSKDVEQFFMEEALISVFQNDSYILQIVLVVPIKYPKDGFEKYQTFKKRNIFKCTAASCQEGESRHSFYVALRKEFCPKLKIRRAVEEDNDDIIAILDKKCPRLKELYGEFYISEIIGRHPEMNRKILVADNQSIAVGVICLNSDINYELLQNTYELEPYHGLIKTTALEKEKNKRSNKLLRKFGEPIMLGQWSPFSEHKATGETAPIPDELPEENIESSSAKKLSRVNFQRNKVFQGKVNNHFYMRHLSSEFCTEKSFLNLPPIQRKSTPSVADLLEEEPFDYEIVNIDKNWLTLPEVISSDVLDNARTSNPRQSTISQIQNNIKQRFLNVNKKSPQQFSHTKYEGEPDAFMIELFGFREDIDERQGYDLLEASFEVMKQFDYCIIRVPCTEKSFPLLQHFCFVPAKLNANSEYALYIAHRNSVMGKLRVRRAEIIDIPQIAQLMQRLDGKDTIWTVEEAILKRNEREAYVFLCGVAIIGVGILEPPENIDIVPANFNIDAHHIRKYHYTGMGFTAGFSTLKAVLAYPVFEPHFRFFIRDMMRQSNVISLLWLTAYRNKWVIHKANSLAPCMIPLLPRKFELNYFNIEDLKYLTKLCNTLIPFSSWFISKKLTSIPRVNIDTRIVIVGSSRTAMAFVNKLIFGDACSYLFFTNVTLISSGGLPYVRHPKSGAERMFLKRQPGGDRYLKMVPFTYYLNIIQGTMVEINKKEKYVKLSNDSKYHYDMLVLLFGKQYQYPNYLKSSILREVALRQRTFRYKRLDEPTHHEELVYGDDTPDNVFVITNMNDANTALMYVTNILAQNGDYKIIVYGSTIHVYCCLATLIEMKVPGENIVFVEPFPSMNPLKARVSVFCNDYVDNAVMKMIDSLNITVYRSYYFESWSMDGLNIATHVEFISKFKLLRLECGAMFYYDKRSVSEQAFAAITKSGMAYDGGIVIDHEFRTLDPAIYAAGPATRYSRRYYADHKRQKYYDSYEVGAKLGSQIRNQLDPLFTENKEKPRSQSARFSRDSNPLDPIIETKDSVIQEPQANEDRKSSTEVTYKLPELKKPRVTYCWLPGGLQYLEVRPPGSKVPHHYVQSLHYNDTILYKYFETEKRTWDSFYPANPTGKGTMLLTILQGSILETFKSGYFKLHLTNDFVVDGITCLTNETYNLEIFTNIYGLSAGVLNNVHIRYTAKKLDNFYEFFRAPWAYFLYHDQAEELFAMVKELYPKGQHQGDTLRDGLRLAAKKISVTAPFTANSKRHIRSNFETSPHIEAITDYVIEWLSENDMLLPIYLQPSMKNSYMYDVQLNPAFRRRRRDITTLLSAIL